MKIIKNCQNYQKGILYNNYKELNYQEEVTIYVYMHILNNKAAIYVTKKLM